MSARLIHEPSGFPYVRERLITVGQNHLTRMHANPLFEHTISSARTNIAWDKYKTPMFVLNPPDRFTDTDLRMHKNEVTSPIPNHYSSKLWSGPFTNMFGTVLGLRIESQHGYLVVVFLGCYKHPKMVGPWRKPSYYFASLLDNKCLFAVAIAYLSKCVCN